MKRKIISSYLFENDPVRKIWWNRRKIDKNVEIISIYALERKVIKFIIGPQFLHFSYTTCFCFLIPCPRVTENFSLPLEFVFGHVTCFDLQHETEVTGWSTSCKKSCFYLVSWTPTTQRRRPKGSYCLLSLGLRVKPGGTDPSPKSSQEPRPSGSASSQP